MDIQEIEDLFEEKKYEELKQKTIELIKKLEKTNKRFDKVLSQSDAQQFQVIKMAEKLKLLLDNTSDGFLQFDEKMVIDSEYSREVEVIFGKSVKYKKITNLLYNDSSKANKLEENLLYILDNPSQAELIFSLFQKEFFINNRFIEVEYKLLPERKFMLILRDITEKKQLQNKIDKENKILKMVVEVVINKEQFLELKQKYINFINNIESYDKTSLKREIHTFKGLFAQKEFITIPEKLHQLENSLNIDKKEMKEWLEEDLKILKEILGEEFFATNYILIDKDRLNKIIQEIKSVTNDNRILQKLELLKDFNILSYFRQYKNFLSQLSIKLEKPINIEFEVEEIYLSDKFKPFLDSLVHVFRNSLDHGIETLEERIINDKPEIGTIKCKVYKKNYNLIIEISDDGRGIDINKLREKIVKKNLLTKKQIEFLSDEIILDFIFEEFSTKDKITNLSGRGMGLNIVKNELKKLNGNVKVKTEKGTSFIFEIPLDLKNSILYFLKECNVIDKFLNTSYEKKLSTFKRLNNCFMVDINGLKAKIVISSNIDKELLKELLNIISGYFIKQFGGDISIPYEKCVNKNIECIEYISSDSIFIGVEGIGNE